MNMSHFIRKICHISQDLKITNIPFQEILTAYERRSFLLKTAPKRSYFVKTRRQKKTNKLSKKKIFHVQCLLRLLNKYAYVT